MGRHRKSARVRHPQPLPSPLFAPEEWAVVVRSLELSPRQAKIVELILQGQKDKQVAATLGSNVWTIRTHLTRIFNRLGITDRVELVVRVFVAARST